MGARNLEQSYSELYREQNEFIVLKDMISTNLLQEIVDEALLLKNEAYRSYIPHYKKSGSISYPTLKEKAPIIVSFYKNKTFLKAIEYITNEKLYHSPENDLHSCALYYYTKEGDHIGSHYDTSHYKGKRITVLLSLVDNSSCRLQGMLNRKSRDKKIISFSEHTTPGSLVIFNGDNIWHGVTALKRGEQRIILSMEFLTKQEISLTGQAISTFKDKFAYFGFQ